LSWGASVPITSAPTHWSQVQSNIAPNEGDYIALHSGGNLVLPSWADGRALNPDVWSTKFDTGMSFAVCPSDSALTTTSTLSITFAWTNNNTVFDNQYTYRLSDNAGWVSDGPTAVNVPAGTASSHTYNITIPDSTYNVNDLTFQVTNVTGAQVGTCTVHYTVSGHVGPPPVAFAYTLSSPVPNPVRTTGRIDFTLAKAANVKLVVYGLDGRKVRTLLDGPAAAGVNSVTWDGLDDNGRRARAGVYFYRLDTPGYQAHQRLVFTP